VLEQLTETEPPPELLRHWGITRFAQLGGRRKQHWLVQVRADQLVLAASSSDVSYEIAVQRHLHVRGWPVPELVRGPVRIGRKSWSLFTRLPGSPIDETDVDRRRRGRWLAELHQSMALLDLGQRSGFELADELVADPELHESLRNYERIRPAEGRILRWHLDWTRAGFARLDLTRAERIVLHGDFAPWNLLFDGDRLSGILDFEAAHRNYRVADFALSWRGGQDEVLAGYSEVQQMNDLDWELLVPVFWSWLFMGMKGHIDSILTGQSEARGFEWQVRHLLRRSDAIRGRVPAYSTPD